MQLTHRFSVPAPLDEAWRAFGNLERLAPCFPGAKITDIDGDVYTGSVKIKFGPLPLVYVGTATFHQRDRGSGRMVVEGRGQDRRGHGTVTAKVSADFTGQVDGTEIAVTTELSLTGRVAQFGGGVVEEVSERLLEEFLACLRPRFAEGLGAANGVAPAGSGATSAADGSDSADADAGAAPDDGPRGTGQDPAFRATHAAPVGTGSTARASDFAGPSRPGSSSHYTPPSNLAKPHLQVLTSVAPPLLRKYGPAAAAVGLAVVVMLRILSAARRRKRR